MNEFLIASSVFVDTAGVGFKRIWDSDTTGNWAILINFLHHGVFTINYAEISNLVHVIGVWNEAGFVRVAVFALGNRSAFNTVIVTSGLVDRASLVSNFILMHIFKSA